MSRMLKWVNRGLDGIITGTSLLGIAIMLSLSIFILFVVLARYVVAVNVPGFFDAAMYGLIVFPFATAAYTLREGKHISVDVITDRLPNKTRAGLELATYPVGTIFIVALAWQALQQTIRLFISGAGTNSGAAAS